MKMLPLLLLQAICLLFLFGCVSLPQPTESSSLAPKTRQETFQSRKVRVEPQQIETVNEPAHPVEEPVSEPEIKTDTSPQAIEVETAPLTEPVPAVPTEPDPAPPEPTTPEVSQPTDVPAAQDSASSNEEILQYKQTLAEEKQKSAALEALVEAQTAKATELEKVVKDQNAVMALLNNEISTLKASSEAPKPTATQLDTIAKLEAKVEEQDSDVKDLEEEIQTMKTLLGQEIEKTADRDKELAEKTSEFVNLTAKNKEVTSALVDHQAMVDDLTKEKQSLTEKVNTQASRIEDLTAKNEELTKQVEEKNTSSPPPNPPPAPALTPQVVPVPPTPPVPNPPPAPTPPPAAGHPFAPAPQKPAPTAIPGGAPPPPPAAPAPHPFAPATPPPPSKGSPFDTTPPPPPQTSPFAPTGTPQTPPVPTVVSPTGGSLPTPPPGDNPFLK